jgi:hypothetical protein
MFGDRYSLIVLPQEIYSNSEGSLFKFKKRAKDRVKTGFSHACIYVFIVVRCTGAVVG